MTLIELKTIDQVLLVVTRPTIASGDQNTVGIKVRFDSAWDGYDKTATFSKANHAEVYKVSLEDDSCVVPAEVLTAPGTIYIGICGIKAHDEKVKTSVLVSYRIKEGAPVGTAPETQKTAVLYTEQELTEEQKAQARENIGAVGVDDIHEGGDVTAESIKDALGYTPADEESVDELSEAVAYLKENGTGGTVTSVNGNAPDENGNVVVEVGQPTDEQIATAVDGWLDEHPEATTTVADGSITTEKMAGTEVVANQILDPVDFKANGVIGYISGTGGINGDNTAIPDGYTNYMTSPFIAVTPNTVYTMNFSPYALHYYDGAETWLSKASVETIKLNGVTFYRFTTSENTAFIRWCKKFDIADGTLETWMICENQYLYDEYFVGKKYVLDAENLCLKDGSLDGAVLKGKSVSFGAVTGCGTLMQLFNQEEYLAYNATTGWSITATGVASGGSNKSYHASDFVAAKPNQIYTCNWKPYMDGRGEYGSIACYDSGKSFIAKVDLNESLQFTTPDGTAYIRFGDYGSTTDEKSANYMICEGEELFSGYVPGGEKVVIEGLLVDKSTPANSVDGKILLDASIPPTKIAPPVGLKILCYGDSLTQNMYPSKVAELLGCEVVDAGVGGNTIAAIYNRVGNYGTDFTVVTLMCGTNDNGGVTSCPLGTVDDEAATDDNASAADTTYVSRLKRLINKIKTTHSGTTYVLMPMFPHAWGENHEEVANMMEKVARLYSIPYLDIYHLCGWRGTDEADKSMYMTDNTHENAVGAQRIAELLAGFIKRLKGM